MKRLVAILLAFGLFAPVLAAQHENHHLCDHGDFALPPLGVPDPDFPRAGDGPAGEGEGAESAEEAEAWDVNDPPGEEKEITVELDEGTWMNLDVSPDGESIVFDLFGDLFRLPIDGGDAEALTSGMAWDMQPRFSPDGAEIAFTSDQGGGDNIWVMPAEGGEARAITEESFRLLNNPAWSPDGRFIAARKHFTSRRSLGSGEIWLYHASGEGGGLQLNEKPNEQKDLGEPAFSRDGKYIYFSQDTTPGSIFLYNKDPNGEIYTIRRIELETGEIESVITGQGGSIRPTPSPDGQSIAFVRRARFESYLYVHDLESGENRRVFGPLERDMQETWAVHGVYANFAWTPDNQSIVIWAGGKLHRVDVASGEARPIPFKVRQTHRLAETLRFKNDPAPENFDVKMLRWVRTSPDGSKVAYQALGKIWIKSLPDGEPQRVTGQEEHFEFYPSWARDGRSLVYVSWHDQELGAIHSVDVASGETRTLTDKPGHWLEPVVSPDGDHVVARKTEGGFITSPLWSKEPGLYAIPIDSGEPERLYDGGFGLHFGDAPDRVYFTTYEPEDRRALRSIRLDGQEERRHAESAAATEWQVSPDGRWLAFAERFHAYVLPFTASSKPLQLGPKFDALPMAKVTAEAGENLHFAGDSATLHWSLGPELFSRPLTDAFTFLDGAPAELPEPPTEGVEIGFQQDHEKAEGLIALVGGRLVTMEGDEVIERGTIVIENDRILAVGPSDEVEVPESATTFDISGKTVIPGIVDVHWHGAQGTSEVQPQQNWYNYATLAFGITTVHDPSNDTSTFFSASELQKAGLITAPRLFSTGTILYGAAGDFKAQVDSLEDARFHLERMKAVGAFSVKSYNQPRRDQRQQVVAAARDLEMLVMPEGGSLYMHNMTMVVDGHTGIEHSIPVPTIYQDVVDIWSATSTGFTPTLGVAYGGIWGENYWYAKTDVWANERLMSFVPRERVDPRSRRPFEAPDEEWNHIKSASIAARLQDVGVEVYVGAHGQREGLASHWEMWMFEQGGMSAHEALRAGTLDGAKYLGMEHEIGSIEQGKLADLAIIDGNPLEDLRVSEKVSHVMLGGRLYDAATMHQVAPSKVERKEFYFEGQ